MFNKDTAGPKNHLLLRELTKEQIRTIILDLHNKIQFKGAVTSCLFCLDHISRDKYIQVLNRTFALNQNDSEYK